MKTYIALLRGINVSGKNKILMADLKLLFQDLGFSDVQTYIQSGNVVFKCNPISQNKLAKTITTKIKKVFNLNVPVIVKTTVELERIISDNPFLNGGAIDIKKLYVVYLWQKPKEVKKLLAFNFGEDEFQIIEDIIYIKYNVGAGKTKLTTNIIENKLNLIATARNWRTTCKLLVL